MLFQMLSVNTDRVGKHFAERTKKHFIHTNSEYIFIPRLSVKPLDKDDNPIPIDWELSFVVVQYLIVHCIFNKVCYCVKKK